MFAAAPAWLQILLLIGAVATALTAVIVLFYKIWPALSKFVRVANALGDPKVIDALTGLPQFMYTTARSFADQDEKIAEIHHETHENNGSSIKDSSKRIEAQGKRNAARLVRVERGVKGLYTREEIDAKNAAIADELERTRPITTSPRSKQ